ncbi:MAG: hypothetical protein HY329_06890, partial [Chloroflexi bacterium]|nr:hypothetical protein [Chloroflexota bacterium]
DGGATWTRAHEALNSNDVNLVVFDPSSADTIYAGAGGTANTESIGGVFVSYDRGHTWSQIKSKLTNTVVQSLAVDPAPPLTLYAGSSGGATFRYDGAGRWQLVTSALPLLRALEPLLLGLALAALVILFAGLRRLPKTE